MLTSTAMEWAYTSETITNVDLLFANFVGQDTNKMAPHARQVDTMKTRRHKREKQDMFARDSSDLGNASVALQRSGLLETIEKPISGTATMASSAFDSVSMSVRCGCEDDHNDDEASFVSSNAATAGDGGDDITFSSNAATAGDEPTERNFQLPSTPGSPQVDAEAEARRLKLIDEHIERVAMQAKVSLLFSFMP